MSYTDRLIIKKSKQARNYTLRLSHKERCIYLVIPHRSSEKRALYFADRHRHWIEEKLSTLPHAIPFEHSEIVPLFDIPTLINITYDQKRKTTHISHLDRKLDVLTNQELPSSRIERYLKKFAKEHLTALTHEKAAELGKKVNKVSIRDTSSRWGSCSSDGNISLSWRLIFAPIEAIDYVVSHEVAHLKHMDHSRNFWKVCESLCDDYTFGKQWIRDEGYSLMRYGAAL